MTFGRRSVMQQIGSITAFPSSTVLIHESSEHEGISTLPGLVISNIELVVIGVVDKYHLIARVLFSCFKPPTVMTSLASVITVGGLKHEK